MRNINRIPIILNFFLRNHEAYNKFVNNEDYLAHGAFKLNIVKITHEWTKHPDYRLGQLLFNMDLVTNDSSYHIEEDNWLISKDYFKYEDLKFWGINYDKEGNKLSVTEYKLLKDLDTEHIENIIKFFKDRNMKIQDNYLKYFNKRLNDR